MQGHFLTDFCANFFCSRGVAPCWLFKRIHFQRLTSFIFSLRSRKALDSKYVTYFKIATPQLQQLFVIRVFTQKNSSFLLFLWSVNSQNTVPFRVNYHTFSNLEQFYFQTFQNECQSECCRYSRKTCKTTSVPRKNDVMAINVTSSVKRSIHFSKNGSLNRNQ